MPTLFISDITYMETYGQMIINDHTTVADVYRYIDENHIYDQDCRLLYKSKRVTAPTQLLIDDLGISDGSTMTVMESRTRYDNSPLTRFNAKTCSICFEDISVSTGVGIVVPCLHIEFCVACAHKLRVGDPCPLCCTIIKDIKYTGARK